MKLPVWSYSFLSTYDRCPKQAQAKYVNRNYPYEGESDALRWGNQVHAAFEHRIKDGTPLPPDMQQYEKYAQHMLSQHPQIDAEIKLGVRRDYSPCGFFDKDVYGRGKLDVPILNEDLTEAVIFDWKTGKEWEDPLELKIGALLLKAKYPTLTAISGAYVWLKNDCFGTPYDLSDTDTTRKWIDDVMMKAERSNFWTPKRNALCGWCALKECPNWREKQ